MAVTIVWSSRDPALGSGGGVSIAAVAIHPTTGQELQLLALRGVVAGYDAMISCCPLYTARPLKRQASSTPGYDRDLATSIDRSGSHLRFGHGFSPQPRLHPAAGEDLRGSSILSGQPEVWPVRRA